MISLTAISVRNLDDHVTERLRIRAARHGRSVEAEIRAILVEAVREPSDPNEVSQTLVDRFGAIGGAEISVPTTTGARRSGG